MSTFARAWQSLTEDQWHAVVELLGSESWITARTFSEFVEGVREEARSRDTLCLRDDVRTRVAHDAIAFHARAGTLTEAVRSQIAAIEAGAEIVRVAHQPELFPSFEVLAQDLVCADLARRLSATGIPTCPLHVVIDYDITADKRYRTSQIPYSGAHLGTVILSAPISDRSSDNLMSIPPKPSRAWLERVLSQLSSTMLDEVRSIPPRDRPISRAMLRERLDIMRDMCVAALDRAASLSDFNSILLSLLVNLDLGLPTVFVTGSTLLRGVPEGFAALLQESAAIATAKDRVRHLLVQLGLSWSALVDADRSLLPAWLVCHCGRRLALRRGGNHEIREIVACGSCGHRNAVEMSDMWASTDLVAHGRLIPRVLADDLLEGSFWNYTAGCSYKGGFEHCLVSWLVARQLGWRVMPEFLSAPKASLPTLTEFATDSANDRRKEPARTAMLYYLCVYDAMTIKADLKVESLHNYVLGWTG